MQTAIDYKLLCEQKDEQIVQRKGELAAVNLELDNLKKMVFGSKRERFISAQNPAQFSLDIQAQAKAERVVATEKVQFTRTLTTITKNKKGHAGRMKLPEHLERRETIVEPAEDVSLCKKIGDEITEELEYEPGELYVNRIVRPKYAKPDNGSIVTAPMIERPLPKAIAGPALLANIAIEKYPNNARPVRCTPFFNILKSSSKQ